MGSAFSSIETFLMENFDSSISQHLLVALLIAILQVSMTQVKKEDALLTKSLSLKFIDLDNRYVKNDDRLPNYT